MRVCKTLCPQLYGCPMIHLFHLNEVKFNFLKLFGCLCFDLDPETECKLFADKLEMGVKISKWSNFVKI